MKYLERLLQQGWQINAAQDDSKVFYITIAKSGKEIIGSSDFSLSMALESILDQIRDDDEFWQKQ